MKKFKKLIKSMSDNEIENIATIHNINVDGHDRKDAENRLINDLTDEEKTEILKNACQ